MFLGQEVHYYMVYIAYFTELICKFAIMRKNDAFVAKMVNTRLTKVFMTILAPDERLPTSATLNDFTSEFIVQSYILRKTIMPCIILDCVNSNNVFFKEKVKIAMKY